MPRVSSGHPSSGLPSRPPARPLSELQLDALRELSNIGSGNAGTALASMLGRPVDISVPTAAALPLADAVDVVGRRDEMRHAVVLPIGGDLEAIVLLLFPEDDAQKLCAIYGIEPATPDGRSMLGEIGNILGSNYINVLAQMAILDLEPAPPQVVHDLLGAIVQSVLLVQAAGDDTALILDSSLTVENESCSLSFLLLAGHDGVHRILEHIGL
jgi:chemotaxis protein CheC